jgi:hypothetical protein
MSPQTTERSKFVFDAPQQGTGFGSQDVLCEKPSLRPNYRPRWVLQKVEWDFAELRIDAPSNRIVPPNFPHIVGRRSQSVAAGFDGIFA